MFWNVRAMPALVTMCGALAVMSRAVERRPCPVVGLYSPVMQLKNVVLPAPLGPMSDTIDLLRDGEVDVVDRHQAAEALR